MTTLHKAAQGALEALCLPCDRWNATQYKIVGKAIDDLRAALAQEPALCQNCNDALTSLNLDRAMCGDCAYVLTQQAQQPEAQYVSIDELGDLLHVTPADRWIEGELDRIDPHRHEQGHDGAEAEALRKLVFEFHQACDLLISYCNKHPTMGDSLFSVVLMRQLLGRGRDDVKGPT